MNACAGRDGIEIALKTIGFSPKKQQQRRGLELLTWYHLQLTPFYLFNSVCSKLVIS